METRIIPASPALTNFPTAQSPLPPAATPAATPRKPPTPRPAVPSRAPSGACSAPSTTSPQHSAGRPRHKEGPKRETEQRDRLKLVFHDGTGMCLFYKRLDERVFRVPEPLDEGASTVVLEERELDDLLDGIAIEPAKPRGRRRRIH